MNKFKLYLNSQFNTPELKTLEKVSIGITIINIISIIFSTVASIKIEYNLLLTIIDYSALSLFLVEYLLRLYVYDMDEKYTGSGGLIRYLCSFQSIISLLSIIPILFIKNDEVVIIFRLFRMFKLIEYTSVFALMRMVIMNKSKELVLSMGIVIFLIFLSSCIMYFAEHAVQPDKFKSIPDTMYWAVATVTTIGYGDIYPVTIIGKSITCIIAILGVLVIAIPTGIFASGFSETITSSKEEKDRIQELERLGSLYEKGFLTKEEFNIEKNKILQ